MNQHKDERTHLIANSFDIKLPVDTPGERGSGTFTLNDLQVVFLLKVNLCIFPAASYETAEEHQKLNEEIVWEKPLIR